MENILEQYESDPESDQSGLNKTSDTKGDESKEYLRTNSGDSDFDEKDELLAKEIESNLFDSLNSAESITNKSENDSRNEDEMTKDSKSMELSFDEDFIFPEPRRDLEKEQKERDRLKRKEIKTKKELEEEEREKMQ